MAFFVTKKKNHCRQAPPKARSRSIEYDIAYNKIFYLDPPLCQWHFDCQEGDSAGRIS
jgi:hypothetical protein